jgi:hypothetical protein
MYGTAPAGFDAACRPTVYSKHVVNFTFLRSGNPSPDIALLSSHATQQDMIDLRNWRDVVKPLHTDLDSWQGTLPICNSRGCERCIARSN